MSKETPFPGVPVVTGAAGKGIGSGVARDFAAATRIANTDFNAGLPNAVRDEITSPHLAVEVRAVSGEISDSAFVTFFDAVVAAFRRIDYAVNVPA
ncbi:Uu.00g135200.m01.CDS01 [Anthostomella pinea]|uniref:Uu.00g135200.m01.CDS01 n=1 Tax=Anthostomella pinea TaxID=933095 RepID=A0AAI8YL07_9PEZI|nr:Uu.00g135200.m01.CDS01 [Anthostomella pinea]